MSKYNNKHFVKFYRRHRYCDSSRKQWNVLWSSSW